MLHERQALTPPTLDIRRVVRPVRRRLAISLLTRWMLRGAAAALLGVAILVAVAHLVPWPDSDPLGGYTRWAVVVIVIAAGVTIALAARRWPGVHDAVRQADQALVLKDRLTTAHEFATEDNLLVRLQRDELRERLRTVDMRRAVRLSVPNRELALAGAAALLVVGTALAPNPQAAEQARNQTPRLVTKHAAQSTRAALTHLQKSVPGAKTGTQTDRQTLARATQAENVLRQLQSQLAGAKTQAQALKAIAQAQQSLQKLQAPGAQAQKAVQGLSKALAGGATQSLSKALASSNPAQTQAALQKLQQQLGKLSPGQRAQLARKLEKAANSVPGTLGDQLRQTAFNLSDNNPTAAQQSLQAASRQLADAQSAASAAKLDAQTLRDLQKIKQDVANGVTGAQKSATSGKPGKGSGSRPGQAGTAGQRNGKGKGASAGRGTANGKAGATGKGSAAGNGKGAGKGAANAAGSGAGTGTGQSGTQTGTGSQAGAGAGGSGGQGIGGGAGGGGTRGNGKYESVYIPGKQNGGPSVSTNGPLGSAVPVQSSTFHQLLPQYSSAADSSLGRTTLPPALQAAVKRYFEALGQR